ncbi:cupin domain-containing protein [Oceanicola sp. 502str15]|uniref:cupin domain-containing protein n=1 Tax=Oceanicola sp. 502str15 TaxID=2696061 RepID=UPI002094B5E8|nr:cupin domain-containing protein [Oceanicola sp. 502str15]MCO6385287.1 cupin domain-containing protein [Oceanicola sp. 502str15]
MSETMTKDGEARKALAGDLKSLNFAVHQPDDPPLFTSDPKPAMQPWHWKAADIKTCLDRIGEMIKLEAGGVRRTLRLANPGFPYGTTPSLWASIQYILPGEVATAHRHTASALRFIMQGEGADTIVDGEQYEMNKGDLVITPNWAFHDHEHKGDEPMIWLDVLDITLVRNFDAVFFEGSDIPRRGVNAIADASYREFGSGIMAPANPRYAQFENPLLVYSRERAEAAVMNAAGLEPDPFDDAALEYLNPQTGGAAMSTIGTVLQRLRPGFKGKAHRHTGSSVYYVIRGSGQTTVGDETFKWGPGDFFAVPAWARHAHSNPTGDEAWMFQVNDFPALRALGLWREAEG